MRGKRSDRMALNTATLLPVGCLLLLIQGTFTSKGPVSFPIRVSVETDLSNMTPESYSSSVIEGGVLLGALRRLQETQQDFKFTVKEDPNFGLLLESVNGLAGNEYKQTYWEILSESSGEYRRLDVGIGCYKPEPNEHIVLRFSMWPQH